MPLSRAECKKKFHSFFVWNAFWLSYKTREQELRRKKHTWRRLGSLRFRSGNHEPDAQTACKPSEKLFFPLGSSWSEQGPSALPVNSLLTRFDFIWEWSIAPKSLWRNKNSTTVLSVTVRPPLRDAASSCWRRVRIETSLTFKHFFCTLRTNSYSSRWGSLNLPLTGQVRVISLE